MFTTCGHCDVERDGNNQLESCLTTTNRLDCQGFILLVEPAGVHQLTNLYSCMLLGLVMNSHSGLAKVLVSSPSVATVPIQGRIVPRYSYALGSKTAIVECLLLGCQNKTVTALMSSMVGRGRRLSNAKCRGFGNY